MLSSRSAPFLQFHGCDFNMFPFPASQGTFKNIGNSEKAYLAWLLFVYLVKINKRKPHESHSGS